MPETRPFMSFAQFFGLFNNITNICIKRFIPVSHLILMTVSGKRRGE